MRRRAQALGQLVQRITKSHAAQEFDVHSNSLRGRIKRWEPRGLVGLHEDHHEELPSKLSLVVAERMRQVAREEDGAIGHIMQRMKEQHPPLLVQPDTAARCLKAKGLS